MPATLAPVDRTCTACGKPFVVTPQELAFLAEHGAKHGWPAIWPPTRCADCRYAARTARDREDCVEPTGAPIQLRCFRCNATFTFGTKDQEFYWRRGFSPPKTCRRCRAARRAAAATTPNSPGPLR